MCSASLHGLSSLKLPSPIEVHSLGRVFCTTLGTVASTEARAVAVAVAPVYQYSEQ